MEIKLTEEQKELFRINIIHTTNGDIYSYFPYWIKTTADGRTYMMHLDELPTEVIKLLEDKSITITQQKKHVR